MWRCGFQSAEEDGGGDDDDDDKKQQTERDEDVDIVDGAGRRVNFNNIRIIPSHQVACKEMFLLLSPILAFLCIWSYLQC